MCARTDHFPASYSLEAGRWRCEIILKQMITAASDYWLTQSDKEILFLLEKWDNNKYLDPTDPT